MRISDWSSDVCSSDLTLRFDQAVAFLRTGNEVRPLQVETLRFVQERVDQAYAEGIKLLRAGDRKSVVEGKCVSVRVDLGGRSIIKKKSRTTAEHNSIINDEIEK